MRFFLSENQNKTILLSRRVGPYVPTQTKWNKKETQTETEAASSTPRVYQCCAGPSIVPVCAGRAFAFIPFPFHSHSIVTTCTAPDTSSCTLLLYTFVPADVTGTAASNRNYRKISTAAVVRALS